MKKTALFLAALGVLFIQSLGIAQTSQRWVTAYHPTWWYGTMKPSQIDFSSMTHIAIFPAQDASASAPYFNSAGIDDGSDFPQIVTMAHAKGVKVLISACGGYGQVNMPVVAADPVKCQAFVDAACSFAKSKNADGIELDWEFPRASDDVGWNRLIRLFRQKLDTWSPKGVFATSMFYSIGGASSSPYYRDSMMVFDQINLMSYTMWMGSSAGPFKSGYDTPVNLPSGVSGYNGWALNSSGGGPLTFIAAGYPASKLGLGVSFEGTRFDGVTGLGQAYTSWGFTSSVTSPLGSGYAAIPTSGRVWDPVAQANYCVSGSTVYSFQDTNSVKAISNWAKDQSWGGVMIYDLGTGYDKSAAVPDAMLKVAGRITLGAGSTVPVAAPTGTFKSSASTLPAGGGTVTLTWTSMNAASAIIDQGVGTVAVNGSTTVSVTANKTFTLTLTSAGGVMQQYTVTVAVASAQPTGTFTSSVSSLPAGGGSVTLTWTSLNAASASIDQGVGTVAVNGSTTVSVTATKTFTLTLTSAAGTSVSYAVPVTVAAPAGTPAAQSVVYDDTQLTSPWSTDGSYSATMDPANTEKVLKGTTSLKVVGSAWGAVQFRHGTWNGTTTVDATQIDSLHMAIYGGTTGVQFALNLANAAGTLIGTQIKFSVPANVWTIKSIPMSQLNSATTAFTLINIQVYQSTAATFYFDDVNLVSKATVVPPPPTPVLPAAPAFIAPASSSTNNPTSLTVSWTKISTATAYHLQVSADSTFKACIVNDSTCVDTLRTLTNLANSTVYYRRVRAKNTAGWSSFSLLSQFATITAAPAAPVLASPANGAVNQAVSVSLTWNASVGASAYRVQLAADSLFSSLVIDDSTVTSVSKAVASLQNGMKYFWRVNARNIGGVSPFSAFRSFATLAAAPSVPVTVSPANGAANQAVSLKLTWNAPAGASTYRVQVAADPQFSTVLVDDATLTTASYALASLSNLTQYYWRVSASNAGGTSAFSPVQTFTTAPYAKTAMFFTYTAGTGNNASVAIPSTAVISMAGVAITNGDEIGAFTPAGICVGSVEWNGTNVAMTVWGDNAQTPAVDGMRSGEMIQYRLYRQATNTVYPLVTVQYGTGIGMYQPDGLAQISAMTTTTVPSQQTSQSIALTSGWNMISTYLKPNTTPVDSLTLQLVPNMTVLKNGAGQVYWPSMGINTLGYWNFTNGYMIYMEKAGTLNCMGVAIVPEATPIALSQGWNLAPYVRSGSMNVATAVAGLGSAVTVVKNSAGQLYWPSYSINTMGSMVPGQAYQIYVAQSSTLVYPANGLAKVNGESVPSALAATVHYPMPSQRGGSNEIILVKTPGLADGDEVAVWTASNVCAGAAVVKNGSALVTVWSDDAYTHDVVEGAVEGEALSVSRWSNSDGREHAVAISGVTDGLTGATMNSSLIFAGNAVVIATTQAVSAVSTEPTPTTYALEQNYPNPFNPSTIIRYALPSDGNVSLVLYNLIGQPVRVLVNEAQHAGLHEISFNAAGLPSGTYLYKVQSGSFTATKKMILLK